jgi:putative membrane protein
LNIFHIFAGMKFIIKLIVKALAVILAAYLMPGVKVDSVITAIVVAASLSFLDAVVKPIMILLTIPVTIFTLGFFLLVINAFMVMIAAYFIDGFKVDGFFQAFLFSIVLWLTSLLLQTLANNKDDE